MMRQLERPDFESGWGRRPHRCCSVSDRLSLAEKLQKKLTDKSEVRGEIIACCRM